MLPVDLPAYQARGQISIKGHCVFFSENYPLGHWPFSLLGPRFNFAYDCSIPPIIANPVIVGVIRIDNSEPDCPLDGPPYLYTDRRFDADRNNTQQPTTVFMTLMLDCYDFAINIK